MRISKNPQLWQSLLCGLPTFNSSPQVMHTSLHHLDGPVSSKMKHHLCPQISSPFYIPYLCKWYHHSLRLAKRKPIQVCCTFQKSVIPLHFYKRSMLIPIFANNQSIWRVFSLFLQKKAKSKEAFSIGFAASRYRAVHPEQREGHHQSPSLLHSASQHPAARALNFVSVCALSQVILCIH